MRDTFSSNDAAFDAHQEHRKSQTSAYTDEHSSAGMSKLNAADYNALVDAFGLIEKDGREHMRVVSGISDALFLQLCSQNCTSQADRDESASHIPLPHGSNLNKQVCKAHRPSESFPKFGIT